ncbi:MAG: hypothetical protein QNJ51_15630 [Calothrix sp. MO_167.B12]|nr:hypothetical protein [Calothrix sp. MO_167.B12]
MYTHNVCILPDRQSYPEITNNSNLYASEPELLEMLTNYIQKPQACRQMGEIMHQRSLEYIPTNVVKRISQVIESSIHH